MPTVSDVIRLHERELITIRPSATVMEAVQVMNDNHIGAVLVMDGNRLAGIFTERDVLRRVVAAGRNPRDLRIREVMTTEVLCCRPLTDIDDVAALMQTQRIRHLPIIDENDIPTGIISIGDINAFNVQHKQATIDNLADYIYGRG